MLIRIAFNGLFIGGLMIAQYLFNFLGVSEIEKGGTVFTLFIVFQLFNAFNSRELGKESVLKSMGKNKIMVLTFGLTFLIQLLIVTFIPSVFGISALSLRTWLKILAVGTSIIVVSELYKFVYRTIKNRRFYKNPNKINKKPVRSVN
jgi:Ca2+-transporting ATPase